MSEYTENLATKPKPSVARAKRYGLHLLLFVTTLFTTTLAGAEWMSAKSILASMQWREVWQGLWYSVPFLAILTTHEFGHYFAARLHQVPATLPYYIPMYFPSGVPGIGTLGAFIRIQAMPRTRQQFFDIGIAGPLAGFVVALGVLWYAHTHLPPKSDIFRIHPEYQRYGLDYENHVYTTEFDSLMFAEAQRKGVYPKVDSEGNPIAYDRSQAFSLRLGDNLIMRFFREYVAEDPGLVPNPHELFHYPLLFAGYLALFFTALNLIPIGQLDGGHILYGLIGYDNHRRVSPVLFTAYMFYGGLGVVGYDGSVDFLGIPMSPWTGLPFYVAFLYFAFSRMTDSPRDTLLLSIGVLTAQWLLTYYTDMQGYSAWLVFGFILGRFLGVYHPPALYEEPLSAGRKVLGWVALGIFILCFTPEPFQFK